MPHRPHSLAASAPGPRTDAATPAEGWRATERLAAPGPWGASLPLSVCIVCKDNESTIGRVLESVRGLAAEVVAVDSGSRDRTLQLLEACRSWAAVNVMRTHWRGHVATKQLALERATEPWVLCLDSDEPVEADLAGSIRELLRRDEASVVAARVNRKVFYRGAFLDHAWQPEWRLRLVRRSLVVRGLARWGGLDPHDKLEVPAGAGRVVNLVGTLRHESFTSFEQHLNNQWKHAKTAARAIAERGGRGSLWKLATSPVGAFVKQIVGKGAWRDGVPGWLAAGTAAAGSLMKHMILLEAAAGPTVRGSGSAAIKSVPHAGPGSSDRSEAPASVPRTGEQARDRAPGVGVAGGAFFAGEHRSDMARKRDAAGADSPAHGSTDTINQPGASAVADSGPVGDDAMSGTDAPGTTKKRRRRRRSRGGSAGEGGAVVDAQADGDGEAGPDPATGQTVVDVAAAMAVSATTGRDADGSGSPGGKRRRRRGPAAADRPAADRQAPIDDGEFSQVEDDDATEASEVIQRVKPHDIKDPTVFRQDLTFAQLGLHPTVLKGIEKCGFTHPTGIQADLVPLALTGRDILGQAKTGTGKTAAFGLPILHHINSLPEDERRRPVQALVIAPTRELAIQIQADFESWIVSPTGREQDKLRVAAIYGGQKISVQESKLARGPQIIVGTPGRILDLQGRGVLKLSGVRLAVLDEVDRMFDIGFRDDIRRILSLCPAERQTVFVSATLTDEIEKLARRHMRDAEKLVVASGSLTVEMVKQFHVPVPPWDKRRMLVHLLQHEEPTLTLVFCRMKRTVDMLVEYLERKNIEAHAIHGDMRQGKRNQVMQQLRGGQLSVLVASDLASRGIDVDGITHVINFDLPEDPDVYVHRIGRTARAGRDGIAYSLVTPEQGKLLTEIEKLINAEIPPLEYGDFDFRAKPEGWKDEGLHPNRAKAEEVAADAPPPENRFDTSARLDKVATLSTDQLAAKFPGGVVPGKMPRRTLGGKIPSRRK